MALAALPARADNPAQLDSLIDTLSARFDAMQQDPQRRIPAEILRKAQGIIMLDRTKAGFLFAYEGGGGVAMAKTRAGTWGPAAFLKANEGSLGFQIGAEQNFFVILFMTTNAARFMTDPKFDLAGEASGTAGNASGGVESSVSNVERPVLVYGERQGLYGGAALKAGAVTPDEKANRDYYGQPLTMRDILYGNQVKASTSAAYLASKIRDYSHPHHS